MPQFPTPHPARLALLAAVLALLPGCRPAPQAGAARPALTVQAARVVAVPPGVKDTSVFGTLRNPGARPLRLTGVQTGAADHAMLMVTRTDARGLTGMAVTGALTVPAGGELVLSDTGDHIMLMGLRAPLREGETVALTLTDDAGGTHTLQAPVVKP
ncbi:copper chaperone PCu(A)C [Deinococcus arcticus]|uniref:Copper chaperone PCu(A)C n=1 Tax=Deinococcus arcticus TaxID=2136176 RepID=A0A2T3W7C8_9DEIO|nr:copper chaperone PCu(A)C [Deinococcus arcticus]PTA67821.1 copper chaperone PCu(A)C [Deinococcus arcticus]